MTRAALAGSVLALGSAEDKGIGLASLTPDKVSVGVHKRAERREPGTRADGSSVAKRLSDSPRGSSGFSCLRDFPGNVHGIRVLRNWLHRQRTSEAPPPYATLSALCLDVPRKPPSIRQECMEAQDLP